MANISGSFTIGGVTDAQLAEILELKSKNEGKFTFNPQQLQPIGNPQGTYNNANFSFSNPEGFRIISKVIDVVFGKQE